ncbi:hypothetical protein TNCV_186691 [Trichonephila clavipes]|nr:hypothetical protein TNCV_186691 [Trichonephila clavipes]
MTRPGHETVTLTTSLVSTLGSSDPLRCGMAILILEGLQLSTNELCDSLLFSPNLELVIKSGNGIWNESPNLEMGSEMSHQFWK